MNRFFILLFAFFLAGGVAGAQIKGGYTLRGDLSPVIASWEEVDPDSLSLTLTAGNGKTDTLSIQNGRFTHSGYINTRYVSHAYLQISAPSEELPASMTIPVFLEPGEIRIVCRELPEEGMFDVQVKGTPSNDLITDRLSRYYDLNYEMLHTLQDTTLTDSTRMGLIERLYTQQDSLIRFLYRDNRDTSIAPILAIQEFYGTNRFREAEEALDFLNDKFPDHPDLHDLESVWMSMEGITAGDLFPDIELPDENGNAVRLKELHREGYLLVDFWASVVGPCLEDFPALGKLPDSYRGEPLTLIGISTDNTPQSWKNTLKKYKPAGIQLWDKYGEASASCHVTSYPVRFLVAPTGEVIAKGRFTTLPDAFTEE